MMPSEPGKKGGVKVAMRATCGIQREAEKKNIGVRIYRMVGFVNKTIFFNYTSSINSCINRYFNIHYCYIVFCSYKKVYIST